MTNNLKDSEKKPEIQFCEFDNEWEQHQFSDMVLIERGGSPRPIEEYITNAPDGLNWVKIGDAPSQGNYITKTAQKIKASGLSKTRQVVPGDLILSNSMSFGKPYIMGINGCIHDGWLLIRDIRHQFNLQFLCYLLGTNNMLQQYKSLAGGSTVNNLNKELVGGTKIAFPCLNEQQRIGEFFYTFDQYFSLQQRKYIQLVNMKSSLLEKMFPRDGAKAPEIRFDGFTDDWRQGCLNDLTKRVIVGLASSVTPYYQESGIPILRNLNIKENHLDDNDVLYLNPSYAERQSSKLIHTGDVLTVHTGYIGTSCVVPAKYDNCLTFTTLVTTTDQEVLDGNFLSQYLNSKCGIRAVQAVTTQGGRQNLNVNDFVKVKIQFPCIEEQRKISKLLTVIDDIILKQQQKIIQLKNIKQSFLDKMFVS